MSIRSLLRYGLLAGLPAHEFWDLTPQETYLVVEVSGEREKKAQKRELAQAWWSAAFARAKRLPSLRQVLSTAPARPLKGAELVERRKDFDAMRQSLDISKLKPRR